MKQYIKIGKKIYRNTDFKDFRRATAFVARAMVHNSKMKELIEFFKENTLRSDITEARPYIFSQAVRPFFFRRATFQEKLTLIKEHFRFFESHFTEEALRNIYLGKGLPLWSMEHQNETLSIYLHFHDINKKEGLMTAILKLGSKIIYQLVFWIASDKNGEKALWIGALQGLSGGLDTIRALTKQFFGYRPKNMILRVVRVIAEKLSIQRIYGVSNYGFYDSILPSHKQKLKTSLDEFWQETGGIVCSDPRFFELPIVEYQKSIEEIVSHKRNLYRKRFALLSEIDGAILEAINAALRVL